MDEITFPVTVTMEQMLRHNAAMDELARLRAQLAAVPVKAIGRLTLGKADYPGWDEDQEDVVAWLKTQAQP